MSAVAVVLIGRNEGARLTAARARATLPSVEPEST